MSQIRPVARQRLSDVAFEQLADAIIRGELQPGERIRDAELADRLQLSRTPVREAINRLIELGLCESKPSSHTRVSPLTQESVLMTLEVLRSLDHLAVEAAGQRLTPKNLDKLRALNSAVSAALATGDPSAVLDADVAFHRFLHERSENPVLLRVISQLDPHVQRILHRKFSSRLGGENSIHHHESLISLLQDGETGAAADLSSSQWQQLGGQVTALFDPADPEDDWGTV
ncbi:GntR family transcriptional regulator [Leucobacter sp. M11]|uniref:GntR family transcriptional regulator n=1 Tax=Leucobacter sp. M11 TaxID=2993565 RepID=UPI002D800EA4|nr:GntR family transcriptional regulator [Leucobacter sp. M11]MEB4614461.1 GntR family transcriptional regulator [Leucobacter sp. M11]